jgi:hypothetical protein
MDDQHVQPDDNAAAGADAENLEAIANLFGDSPSDDAAPFEGAADQPELTEAGETETESGEPQPSPDEIRAQYEARIAEIEANAAAERQRVAQERHEEQVRQQQRNAEVAAQQWQSLEQQALAQAAEMSYEDSHRHLASFYRQREQAILAASQQTTQQVQMEREQYRAERYLREEVIPKYGLTPDDAAEFVGMDPRAYHLRAERLANDRKTRTSELDALRKEVEQLKRGAAAQRRIDSGVDRPGGPNGQPLPRDMDSMPLRDMTRLVLQV